MNDKQQQLVQILSALEAPERERFMRRFAELAETVHIVKPVRDCYNCGNRFHESQSAQGTIQFDKCQVAARLFKNTNYCENIMQSGYRDCREWTPQLTLWQKVRGWFA